jgi:hypothetical protein
MKKLSAALILLFLSSVPALAAPLESPCTQSGPGAARCDPVNTGNPLPMGIYYNGTTAQISLDGALSVNTPASPQFADTFSAALDTTYNWTLKNSTGTAAVSAGQLVINSSTTASAWGGVSSQQTFAPVGVSPQVYGVLGSFTVLAQANSSRVFGVFTVPATPTLAVPVTDGYVYRLDATGALFAEIWSSGVAVSSTNVTTACLPAANTPGIFAIVYRASLVQFTCGSALVVNQAPIFGINPVQQVLPVSALSIAGSTPPGASAVMNLSALALAAVSPGSVKSGGQFPTAADPANVVTLSPTSQPPIPAFQIVAQGNGTTGAVSATLAGVAGKITYICGFTVSGAGTGLISPVTVGSVGLSTSPYQGISAGVAPFSQTFSPCIPATAVNTGISVTTTADASATAVDVIAWGFQQ